MDRVPAKIAPAKIVPAKIAPAKIAPASAASEIVASASVTSRRVGGGFVLYTSLGANLPIGHFLGPNIADGVARARRAAMKASSIAII